ncbi:MAG: outer membrane protein assembly factor BamE [Sphingomonadales bacterium]
MVTHMYKDIRRGIKYATLSLVIAGLGACTTIKDQNGYLKDEELMSYVAPGVDNKDSVASMLGRPSLTSTFDDDTWYYVSQLTQQIAFLTPKAIFHEVVAVSFDENGNVKEINTYDKADIVDVNLSGDSTPTRGRELGFLESLFGNIGQVGSIPGQGGAPGGP